MFGSRGSPEDASANRSSLENQTSDQFDGRWRAEIAHSIPGRLRVRVAGLKDNPSIADELREALATLGGIESMEIKPRSGSVVLYFHPSDQATLESGLHRIFASLNDAGEPGSPRSNGTSWQRKAPEDIVQLFRKANQEVESATGGIDLALLVPILLLSLSILGFATSALKKGKFPFPAWYDLLWFAFNTYVILNLTLSRQKDLRRWGAAPADIDLR